MAVPDYQSLMLPLLETVALHGPLQAREAYDHLASKMGLTDADRTELLPSGAQSVFQNRVGWAKTYLKKAGLVDSPKRGVWEITERGRQVLAEKPTALSNKALQRFSEFRDFTARGKAAGIQSSLEAVDAEPSAGTPTDLMEDAYAKWRTEIAAELLERVKSNTALFFEGLVIDLMIAMGYGGSRRDAGEATQMSSDGGIDGVIREDRLGLDTIYLQAKKWEGTVTRPEVQKFAGALQGVRARKGVMITTSTFSAGARDYVSRLDAKIVLIDGEQLAELMVDNNVGVSTKHTYEVKAIDGDYFE